MLTTKWLFAVCAHPEIRQVLIMPISANRQSHELTCSHRITYSSSITAGTLVPAVLMATSHSYGNGQTLTTHRIQTP